MGAIAGPQAEPVAGWIRGLHASRRAKWSLNIAFIVLVALAAWGLAGLYNSWNPRAAAVDQRFVDRQALQRETLRRVRSDLQAVRRALPPAGRADLRRLQDSIRALERHSGGLVQQLALAKRENDALRRRIERGGGPAGGYDFTVAEDAGLRLDDSTVLGVAGVGRDGVRVNLTTAGDNGARGRHLASGQSISYRDADGRACKVSLLGTRVGDVGAAVFGLGCR